MATAALQPLIPSEMQPKLNPVLVTDNDGLKLVADFLKRTSIFGMDAEWQVTNDFFKAKLRTIQLGDRTEQYIIDLLPFAGSEEALIASQGNYGAAAGLLLGDVIGTIRPALENPEITKVGVNMQSDYEMLFWNLGIRSTGFFDCMIAEKNIYAGLVHFMSTGFWAMEDLVRKYLGLEMQDTGTGKTFDLSTPLTEHQVLYCALDARLNIGVRAGQLRALREAGLETANTIDCDAISPFGDMRIHGIGIDVDAWMALVNENIAKKRRVIEKLDTHFVKVVGTKFVSAADMKRLDDLEEAWRDCPQKTPEEKQRRRDLRAAYMEIRKSINVRLKLSSECEGDAAINYASNAQLLKAFRKMGYGIKKMPNTDDKTLEKLAKYPSLDVEKAFKENNGDLDYPVIDLLRLLRSIAKLIDTYGEAWVKFTDEGGNRNRLTGRIHSFINLLGAATGRTSSSSPNIQNLPKDNAYRNCFVARPGYKLLTVDYSGAELRILAFMSQEPVWLQAFLNSWDVHSVGAEMLYGDRWKTETVSEPYLNEKGKLVPKCAYYYNDHQKCECPGHKKLRNHIKSVNFGLAYGLQAKGLADQLGISVEDAEKLLADYKAAFPTVMKFLDELGETAKTALTSRTVSGRRRRWVLPTWDIARERVQKDLKKDEDLTTDKIRRRYVGMFRSIEREGKNMPIQGANADLTKRAMFLVWSRLHTVFGAFFVNMVHDELVIEVPEEHAESCYKFVAECMEAAGAEYIKGIRMEVEGHTDDCWMK